MSGRWCWTLLLALAICILPDSTKADDCAEGCWESCFQQLGTENFRYRDVWEDLLEIAFEITQLKDVYNITKVGFLIDSSISSHYNVMENNNTESLESGKNVFKFELLLAIALSLIVNGQFNYIVQYNEESAWTCNEFNCLTSCKTFEALNQQSWIEMGPTSHCPGNIEAACKLTNQVMSQLTCANTNSNTMVIAITNGKFVINGPGSHSQSGESHDHRCPPISRGLEAFRSSSSSSSEEFFSACHSYFNTRYAIGVLQGSRENFEHFPSKHGNYRYFHAEKFSYDALLSIINCSIGAAPKCCAGPLPSIATSTCQKTQGPLGEIVSNFPTHPSLASITYGIFGPSPISTTPIS